MDGRMSENFPFEHVTISKMPSGITVLTADDGWWLYNGETCTRVVYIGRTGRMEDWSEVDHYIAPPEPEETEE